MSTTPTRLWTVEEYHRMAEVKILHPEERVELIEGEIIPMPAKRPAHSVITQTVSDYLKPLLVERALVRTQEAIHLSSHSEPEPDIAVVQLPLTRYLDHHPYPEEVFLIIEVADRTLNYDRKKKAATYAKAGIADYWVVDVKKQRVFVFREPGTKTYQQEVVLDKEANLALIAFPDINVSFEQFFP